MPLPKIDWNAPRTPCQTEGCDYPNFHVCLVGKPDLFPKLVQELPTAKKSTKSFRSDSHRQAVSEAQKARWAAIHAQYEARDQQIIERYATGTVSLNQLAKEFHVGRFVIRRVIAAAEAEGVLVVRPVGLNIRYEKAI